MALMSAFYEVSIGYRSELQFTEVNFDVVHDIMHDPSVSQFIEIIDNVECKFIVAPHCPIIEVSDDIDIWEYQHEIREVLEEIYS